MKKRRAFGFSLLVMLSAFGLWRYWWSALDQHTAQDACSFGQIGNDRYLEMLAQAKELKNQRPSIRQMPVNMIESEIRDRFHLIARPDAPFAERLAANHAVMRSLGAYHVDRDYLEQEWRKATGRVELFPNNRFLFEYRIHSSKIRKILDPLIVEMNLYRMFVPGNQQSKIRHYSEEFPNPIHEWATLTVAMGFLGGGILLKYNANGSCPLDKISDSEFRFISIVFESRYQKYGDK